MRFGERLAEAVRRADSLLCVGLDPDLSRYPAQLGGHPSAIVAFNRAIIEATIDLACAYKPNLGFYLAYGEAGVRALVETRRIIGERAPVILDAKVGDIGVTSAAYARGYFDEWGFDALTVNPFLGLDSIEPFLAYQDRACFILAKTSNPGSGDLQDIPVAEAGITEPLYLHVARRARRWNECFGTCGVVVGATWPAQLAQVRERCPDLPILVPGIGAQGGDLQSTVRAGLDRRGAGLIINVSRAISYASGGPDFADRARDEALRYRDAINAARRTSAAGSSPVPG